MAVAVNDPRSQPGHPGGVANVAGAAPGGTGSGSTGSASPGFARNPPFTNTRSHRNQPYDHTTGTRTFRGYLQEFWRAGTSQGGKMPPVNQQYRLYFYYNPNDISVSWNIDDTLIYAPEYQTDGQSSSANGFVGTTVSFDMFFDRVSETDFVPEGVLQDVRIFDKIVTGGAVGANGYDLTYASMPYVRVQFSRNGGGIQPPLGYIGVLTAAGIDYTQFDVDMVPTRCVIQVTMRALVFQPEITPLDDPGQGAGGTAGYTTPKYALGTKLNALSGYGTTIYVPGSGNRSARDFGGVGTSNYYATGSKNGAPIFIQGGQLPETRPGGGTPGQQSGGGDQRRSVY